MTTRCVVKHPHLAIWGIPKGGLGYEKRGFRASEQGCRGGVFGCRGLRNGGAEASLHAQNWVKGEKDNPFLQFSGLAKRHRL